MGRQPRYLQGFVWRRTCAFAARFYSCSLSAPYRPQVPTAIDHSPSAGLLVTAHTDKLLRLWDPRTSEGQVMKSTLSSHSSWVTCVSWHPSSAVHVLSGSVDKTACLWDVSARASLLVKGDCALLTTSCAGSISIRHVHTNAAHARGVCG